MRRQRREAPGQPGRSSLHKRGVPVSRSPILYTPRAFETVPARLRDVPGHRARRGWERSGAAFLLQLATAGIATERCNTKRL